MKSRILPYLTLFIIGLIGAYLVSGPKEKSRKGQVWLNLENKISTIEYLDEKVKVSMDVPRQWILESKIQDGMDLPPKSYKANKKSKEIVNEMENLQAIKVIGKFEDINKEEYGFSEKSPTLSIITKNEKYLFTIGKRSFQSSNVFVHDHKQNRVFLMRRNPINLLRNPKARLYENKIHSFNLADDVTNFSISSDGKALDLKKDGKSAKGKVVWKRVDKDEPSEAIATWVNKTLKLKAKQYATKEESQKLDALKPLLSLKFFKGETLEEDLNLYLLTEGVPTPQYWAKTNYSETFVLVDANRAKTLSQDFSSFFM